MKRTFLLLTLAAISSGAWASSEASWNALYERTGKACLKKSGLKDPVINGDRVVFGKHILYRIDGTYPQAHMQGKTGSVYCLHPYPKGRPEIADAPEAK